MARGLMKIGIGARKGPLGEAFKMTTRDTKFIIEKGRRLLRLGVTMEFTDTRITFLKAPFSLKDEIKAMRGSKWHGSDPKNPRKVWSVSNCARNRFQIEWLEGGNPYEWFEGPLERFDYSRSLRSYQKDLADAALTYHYQIWAAEMGLGKTLAAMEVIEQSRTRDCLWVGPKKTKETIEYEADKWGFPRVKFLSYEQLVKYVDAGERVPKFIVFDEVQRLKNHTTKRSTAAQKLTDQLRDKHGMDGYVLGMSGTPSPKSPVDWWSIAEIVYPGFLREGSMKAFEERLAIFEQFETLDGSFRKRTGWREEEVEKLYDRLKGLVVIKHKKDCLDLPAKIYRRIELPTSPSTLRVAKAIADTAPTAVMGMTLLRELSDGFQYREEQDGERACKKCENGEITQWMDPDDPERVYITTDMLKSEVTERLQAIKVACPECDGTLRVPKMKRIARMVPCPKETAFVGLLEENEEQGRIVAFAGFQGSVDRIASICRREGWAVVRCDGRGWHCTEADGTLIQGEALKFWRDHEGRVAFVGHPESGGLGLTLTEACMLVFWSNSFKPENRIQGEDRIHRLGIDEAKGATIVDLIHLPSDQRVLDIVKDNRRLELMTLGEVQACLAV